MAPHHARLHYIQRRHQQASQEPQAQQRPTKLHPLVLWELREELAPILEAIFTKSLDTGKLPDDWKSANVHVVPIYKKGSKHLPVNYRPVSLTAYAPK